MQRANKCKDGDCRLRTRQEVGRNRDAPLKKGKTRPFEKVKQIDIGEKISSNYGAGSRKQGWMNPVCLFVVAAAAADVVVVVEVCVRGGISEKDGRHCQY